MPVVPSCDVEVALNRSSKLTEGIFQQKLKPAAALFMGHVIIRSMRRNCILMQFAMYLQDACRDSLRANLSTAFPERICI